MIEPPQMPHLSTRMDLPWRLAFSLAVLLAGGLRGEEPAKPSPAANQTAHRGPACIVEDNYFSEEVWAKVGARSCLKCHKPGGDAEDSKFILQDPAREKSPAEALRENRAAFARMASVKEKDGSRLLVKVAGGLDHGGETVFKTDSTGYRILAEFARQVNEPQNGKPIAKPANTAPDTKTFFDGITMLDDRKLLRRVTLSLAGRLPTTPEMAAVEKEGLKAMGPILDAMMKEDAFYDRLAEAFNDIFLTRGYDDVAENVLSYEHFEKTRHWAEKYDLEKIEDKAARQKARYKLYDDYRESMLREPMELIKYIVRNDRPFTEIVTADYILVSPYTARGYGVFDEMREKFKNTEDPFEYLPARLKALKNRSGKVQESPTGFYPHAGMLTTFHYLRRYPTTETNRNRLRARMYYQHFLGIDVLELAPRVSDAAAITAKFETPTMQASECVVCHKTIDPVAGLFQDYYSLPEGLFQPRKEGWFKDMFGPGLEGDDLPAEQKWRSLQWLGERTAKDPRFAATMVEHVYYVLTGRKTLLPPTSLDDPLYDAKQRAYQAQRHEIEAIAARFAKANFNLKGAFKDWVVSPFYRAEAPAASVANNPKRQAELADLGLVRMLAPEQIERKVAAIFGKPWGKFKDKEFALLYGGVDYKEVTERAADPSGAMGAIQRILSNDIACKNVATDFALEPAKRRLFPNIEPDVLPGESAEADQRIRAAIVHLHRQILGRYDAAEKDPEVERTFGLFAGIISDARERKVEPLESYFCRVNGEQRVPDPKYTMRAWRAVVTYLLRQQSFLYE
jgi:hypothetical protein